VTTRNSAARRCRASSSATAIARFPIFPGAPWSAVFLQRHQPRRERAQRQRFHHARARTITWASASPPADSVSRQCAAEQMGARRPQPPAAPWPAPARTPTPRRKPRSDVSGEYRFSKRISIYSSIRNVNHSIKRLPAFAGPDPPITRSSISTILRMPMISLA